MRRLGWSKSEKRRSFWGLGFFGLLRDRQVSILSVWYLSWPEILPVERLLNPPVTLDLPPRTGWCVKFVVPLKASTSIQCTEVGSIRETEAPYSAPRPVFKGLKHNSTAAVITCRVALSGHVASLFNLKAVRCRERCAMLCVRMSVRPSVRPCPTCDRISRNLI